MNYVIVQCPHCRGRMQVDPRYLTIETVCPVCMGPLKPSDHVAPPPPIPMPSPPAQAPDPFNLDDDEPRRRHFDDGQRHTHHTHRTTGAMSAGFFGCFGGCLGMAAALVFLICLAIGGCYLIREHNRQRDRERGRSTGQIETIAAPVVSSEAAPSELAGFGTVRADNGS